MPVRLVPMAGDGASSFNGASAKNAGAAVRPPALTAIIAERA